MGIGTENLRRLSKGKGKKDKKKGKGKENGKNKQDNGEANGKVCTDDSYFAGECGYCGKWGHKKAQCRKQEKDQENKPPAATVQADVTVNQVQSCPPDEDTSTIFAVSASSGRNARILVDSGADEHVRTTSFTSATPLGPAKGGMLCDAQGHKIEAHGTGTVYMRLGPEGQSVGAEFRVTNVTTPILSMEKLVKQGSRFEAGPTGCNMSQGDRSVTLDVAKNSLWVDAKVYTTAEGARNAGG